MSDSSDSDDITPPTQPRRAKTVRNLGRLLKQKSEGFAPVSCSSSKLTTCTSSSAVYTSVGQQSITALKEGTFNISKREMGGDIEEDSVSSKKKTKSPATKPTRYKSVVVEDDEEEELSFIGMDSSQNSARDKSPTPPPTPDIPVKVTNKRKMKGVKAAMKALDYVCQKYQQESSKNDDDADVCIIDVTSPTTSRLHEDNKELMIKIRSRSGIQRYTMKRTDDFSNVFRTMAEHEYAPENRVSICHCDVPIQPYDTPSSINLKITDILDCYIRKEAVVVEDDIDDPDVIRVVVQGNDPHSKCNISLNKMEPLERMMRKYASKVGVPYGQLTFNFDGESLSPTDTAQQLDLEEDFCIDVTGV